MANLRDIINATTPGPWEIDRRPFDFPALHSKLGPITDVMGESDANFIAAYSPDHALLIEDALAAFKELLSVLDFSEYDGWDGEMDAITAYRKERGYE